MPRRATLLVVVLMVLAAIGTTTGASKHPSKRQPPHPVIVSVTGNWTQGFTVVYSDKSEVGYPSYKASQNECLSYEAGEERRSCQGAVEQEYYSLSDLRDALRYADGKW